MDTLTKWSATAATKVKPRLTFKQLALLGLACVAALAGSAYGYHWWTIGRFLESTDDAYVGGNVTPISPHISAFIAEILVTDNQRVNAGQVLVRLDDRDVQAAADHAEANLKQHTAMLASLRAKYALQQPAIRQAPQTLIPKQLRPILQSSTPSDIASSLSPIPVPGRTQKERAPWIRRPGRPWHRYKPCSPPQISN